MPFKDTRRCRLAWAIWLALLAHHYGVAGQTCSWEFVTDPPQPVGDSVGWMFFFRCNTSDGTLPAPLSADKAICYRNTITGCGTAPEIFRRDAYTLEKVGSTIDDRFVSTPNVPAERLRVLFGANTWGIRSPDTTGCTFTFAVAPLDKPADYYANDIYKCKNDPSDICACKDTALRADDDSAGWVTVGTPVTVNSLTNTPATATITPSSTSPTALSGTSRTYKISVSNPQRSCALLPVPSVAVENTTVAACDAPVFKAGENPRGWFAPKAETNTCEFAFTCSLSEGSTTVQISVQDWAGTTLANPSFNLNVLGSTFTIDPSSPTLSRVTGTSQQFTITVTNPTGACTDLRRPTVVVQNAAVATCSVLSGYIAGTDNSCVLGQPISCTTTVAGSTGITITARDWNSKVVATQATTLFVCANFGSGTWTVRGGTGATSYNCTSCSRVASSRTITCSNCFSGGAGPLPGPFTYEVPCNCPSNGVQFSVDKDGNGQLACNANPCSWQLVTDPPLPTVGNEYLLALRCINGDVFASGLSTSQPLCYRLGSDPATPYTLTYSSLASAASDLGLAPTPTGGSAASRLTSFIGSGSAWVAKRPAAASPSTTPVWAARAIPVAGQPGSFTCPAVGGPEFGTTPSNLTIIANPNPSGRLFNTINTVANGIANVGSVRSLLNTPQRFHVPVSILAPAAMCAQLIDPAESITVSNTNVATCSSLGIFRAVAPASSNGGSCALTASINCIVNGWGQATLSIPLSGAPASAWAATLPTVSVQINVCNQLATAKYRSQCSGCRFVDTYNKRKLICTQCCGPDPETKETKCDIPVNQPIRVPCGCSDVAYTYNAETGGTLEACPP